jgi:hypothetical protein
MDNSKKTSFLTDDPDKILEQIAIKAHLSEGKEAIRAILREIYRKGTIGTKGLSKRLFLPLPIVAAIRKELEKNALIGRTQKGAVLTEEGINFVRNKLGIEHTKGYLCKSCSGLGIHFQVELERLIGKFKQYAKRRTKVKTELDQAFGKPITAFRRAFLMLENNDLEGRNVLLLGDDDFTSIAIASLKLKTTITVVDIDNDLLKIIDDFARKENAPITCIQADLRKSLPESLLNSFDVVLTDPPYTLPGLQLFLSRAIQALKEEPEKKVYLAYAHRPANELLAVQEIILSMGLAIKTKIQGFNLYEGAELLGNKTALTVLTTTGKTRAAITSDFLEEIYTGELSPTRRTYQCTKGHLITIGRQEKIKTIEELKKIGCPICGSKETFQLIQRQKIT